jgi:hypothetical protein
MVRPPYVLGGVVSADAYDDKYDTQSFNLTSMCSPQETLEKFAGCKNTRAMCNKSPGDPDPTYLEMFDAGFRVALHTVEYIVSIGLSIAVDDNGDEYRDDGHVNVSGAKLKAGLLAATAHVLDRDQKY